MGCACNRNKIKVNCYSASISLAQQQRMQMMGRFQKKNNFFNNNGIYFNKISQNCTFNIFNFLNFKDLYECGKCCSSFKVLSSNPELLKKFFTNLKNDSNMKISKDKNKIKNINISLFQTFGFKNKGLNYHNELNEKDKETLDENSTGFSGEGTPKFSHMHVN
jgi:hypothetical protein